MFPENLDFFGEYTQHTPYTIRKSREKSTNQYFFYHGERAVAEEKNQARNRRRYTNFHHIRIYMVEIQPITLPAHYNLSFI